MRDSAKTQTPGPLTVVLFVVYAALLVAVILFKSPFQYQLTESGRELNLIAFAGSYSDPRGLAIGKVVENVLIFVPLGVYLSMLRARLDHTPVSSIRTPTLAFTAASSQCWMPAAETAPATRRWITSASSRL
jgi:glycopeptide antibiotics resistance protein